MKVQENILLSECTTFKIGGHARYFFRVKNLKELREALAFVKENSLPFFVLGGGSNVLASDGGFNGVIIKNEISGIEFENQGESVYVRVGAGENWDNFVRLTVERGLFGLENLSGIPGTVGAAPVQNIGAYGVEVKNTVVSVETFSVESGKIKVFSNAECQFIYRYSFFKTKEGKSYVILGVTFALQKQAAFNLEYKDLKQIFNYQFSIINEVEREKALKAITLQEVRRAVLQIRSNKFPDLKKFGTAGSFFKNPIINLEKFNQLKKQFPDLPGFLAERRTNAEGDAEQTQKVKISLAWILDNICKMKGFTKGEVGLFERQPIVLVNFGGANAKSVNDLAIEVVERVKEKTGIDVEWEVQYLK